MSECATCGRPQHADTALVCHRCARDLTRALHDAADLWPELLVTCAGQARMAEPGPRARGLAPAEPARPDIGGADQQSGWPTGLPVHLAAVEVRDAVRNTATTWVRLVAEQRGTIEPIGRTPTLLRWLAGQVEWLRHQRWADEAVDELYDACRRIGPAVDRPAMRTRVAVGPCPDVACAGLVTALVPARLDQAAVLRCGGCGVEWATHQWARAGRRILARGGMVA